jgi:DNA-binding MarR family transcriptional regulator
LPVFLPNLVAYTTKMPAPRSLETNVLFLCGGLSHVLHRQLTMAFRKKKVPLTVEQFSVLTVLFYENGINQQELSQRLDRNKATITRVIATMERNRLIVRKPDRSDARGKLIFLAGKGRALQQKSIRLSGELYMKAIAGIGENSLEACARVLVSAIQNLKEKL